MTGLGPVRQQNFPRRQNIPIFQARGAAKKIRSAARRHGFIDGRCHSDCLGSPPNTRPAHFAQDNLASRANCALSTCLERYSAWSGELLSRAPPPPPSLVRFAHGAPPPP